jgi:GNAT superfamily N-acetyltransferase
MEITTIDPARFDEAVDVLSDAFAGYPVMRFVIGIGPAARTYHLRLRALVGFFTAARLLRGDPVLGVAASDGALLAVANITPPGERPAPPELDRRREVLWQELGEAARHRYETLGQVWRTFTIDRPHYHLNMIGVRRSQHGRGAGRLLLESLHATAANAPGACGITLTTEAPANVPLYEHFGYSVRNHARVSSGLQTWGLFRPNGTPG